jgi:hypothetical protein
MLAKMFGRVEVYLHEILYGFTSFESVCCVCGFESVSGLVCMLPEFSKAWLLPFSITVTVSYFIELHPFGYVSPFRSFLLSLAASLLIFGIGQWRGGRKESLLAAHKEDSPAPPSELVPEWIKPHFLCGLYRRFKEQDADKIVELYKEKFMTANGKVVYVSNRYLFLERKFLWYEDRVALYLAFGKPDSVTALLMGKKVKVRGRLRNACDYNVTLMDGELVKAPKLDWRMTW